VSFAVGSLVKARGREWVVLPESENSLLMLRPLGGTDEEVTGIYLPLETVETATFALPDPSRLGDHRSCRLLRDAVRLGFRASAGPFRSFARLGIEPRPYQLVPLLMALKLDPVRLLIADDVGIGKTVEACLIARELLDRGEIRRIAVLCPPQLAEQWQTELRDKFHIDAELVLPGTAPRLERHCRVGESLFDIYPFVVVSTDFIKSDRRRLDFLRACPEMVIVDEAHTCAYSGEGSGGRHQRHELVKGLASSGKARHIILVTATPHSGNEQSFRSLLGLLDSGFGELPEDLGGKHNESLRRKLAGHLVQRRRADIRHFLKSETPFPDREEAEHGYKLHDDYKRLFARVLEYAKETVCEQGESRHRQRVQWWSALALLRALASSPAAAAATLRTRAGTLATETVEEADDLGRRTVLDLLDDVAAEAVDITPGGDAELGEGEDARLRRRLLDMARQADALQGKKDNKLQTATTMIAALLKEGFRPIIFCRFIATADYVAAALRQDLPKDVAVVAVTSELAPTEREARINQLSETPKHVLVATDCLSEGINLQRDFDAVVHYDLSWNPTRHEQREGRVDRYGQPSTKVRVVTYYGLDNQIDGIVLDVLLRKHKKIRSSLGISVPIPVDTEKIVEAVFEGLLLRSKPGTADQLYLDFEDYFRPAKEDLFAKWDMSAEREKRSRTMFSQEGLSASVEEVERELADVRKAIGSGIDVSRFTKEALLAHGAVVAQNGVVKVDLAEIPRGLRDALTVDRHLLVRFEPPTKAGELLLTRTHPIVEGLASFLLDTALDSQLDGVARRCGTIRTRSVTRRTTVLLLRLRYHIITRQGDQEHPLLAEDCMTVAFEGSPSNPTWLDRNSAEALLATTPDANIQPDQAAEFIRKVNQDFELLAPRLNEIAIERGEELLAAHTRVRTAARLQGVRHRVEAQLPPDVLGVFVYLPALAEAGKGATS
jgi:superfamily II DNA or RNA helicase